MLRHQARFLLSPDQDFSIQGTQTHINYLKAFRTYRNIIIEQWNTPTYQAITKSFNTSLFGAAYTPASNPICGGDGESEEGMEAYRSKLKKSANPLPDHSNIENAPGEESTVDSPSPDRSPHISAPSLPTPDSTDVDLPGRVDPGEDHIKSKKRPVARKKANAAVTDGPVGNNPEVTSRSTRGGNTRKGDNLKTVEQTDNDQRSTRRTKRG